jgi:hypothetical protein
MTTPAPLAAQPVIATVTGKDLLDQLNSLAANFATMSAKLDDLPATVHDHENRLRALEGFNVADHGGRLTTLEQSKWKSSGVAAAISGILSSGALAAILQATHQLGHS